METISTIQSVSKFPKGMDWVKSIFRQLDEHMRPKDISPKPYELNGWSSAMMGEAMRENGGDKHSVKVWREWINRVYEEEGMNRNNLRYLLRAREMAEEANDSDFAVLLSSFLKSEWAIDDCDTEEYKQSTNPINWIASRTRKLCPGPSTAERDPAALERDDR
jgi:hypothetical protein